MQTERSRSLRADEPATLVRLAEPRDEERVVALLARHVTAGDARRRYEWIYHRNPQGPGRMWLATQSGTDAILGFTSIFARDFMVRGRPIAGGVGFDAFVPPAYRGRGLALRLHQDAHAAMLRREVPYRFLIGAPTPPNLRQLARAGARVVGGLRYLGLPLDARGARLLLRGGAGARAGLGARALDRVIDRVLAATRRLVLGAGRARARSVTTVGESFDRLWHARAAELPVVGRRDAAVLRWRFLENPVAPQELIAIESRDALLGWAAVEMAPRGALIVDHLLPLEPAVLRDAVAALVGYLAERGAGRVMMRGNLSGPYAPLLLRCGFLPGRHADDFVLMGGSDVLEPSLARWHLMSGDLNPETSPWRTNSTPDESDTPSLAVITFVDDGAPLPPANRPAV